jgi:hypothetical protein
MSGDKWLGSVEDDTSDHFFNHAVDIQYPEFLAVQPLNNRFIRSRSSLL